VDSLFGLLQSIRKLYFWYYRKRYHVPCKREIDECIHQKKFPDRVWAYAVTYLLPDYTLEDVAFVFNVTRERVRQVLFKIVREANKKENDE
jgi:hypothetical protein